MKSGNIPISFQFSFSPINEESICFRGNGEFKREFLRRARIENATQLRF